MKNRFPRKRVFITGAGSGFGKALALHFAREGWKVATADINAEAVEKTAEEIRTLGGEPLVIACDVTKLKDVEKAGRVVEKAWGGVDIAVNNAGVAAGGKMEKITSEQWETIMSINVKGVINGCRVFIPILEKQGKGHLVNMASS
ncbi:MAG: SDR family NAD(P)-dependent oxidoreductase, partial [Pseudomonadota bacterium]